MSMDFIYDLKDRLDEQGMEYLIFTIKEGRKELVVDTFYAVSTKNSRTALCAAMDNLCEKWDSGEIIETGDEVNLGLTTGGTYEPLGPEDYLEDYDEDGEEEDEDENK